MSRNDLEILQCGIKFWCAWSGLKACGNSLENYLLNVQTLFLPSICFWCGIINFIQGEASNPARVYLSPSKVKEWAIDDLNKTILWLDSQEEKVRGNFNFSFFWQVNFNLVIWMHLIMNIFICHLFAILLNLYVVPHI